MKVYNLSFPVLDWREFSRFIEDEKIPNGCTYAIDPIDQAACIAEVAGRLCYMSYGKGRRTTKEFIDNIIQSKHFSVLEHANWSFIITGISRSCTHELVRHRHFSYSQLSQRYVDESEAEMIMPPVIEDAGRADVFSRTIEASRMAYRILSDGLDQHFTHIENATERRKAARQAARSVLPNATETKIVVTGNARAWREFIQKRNTKFADPEIRALAAELQRQLTNLAPLLFSDLGDDV